EPSHMPSPIKSPQSPRKVVRLSLKGANRLGEKQGLLMPDKKLQITGITGLEEPMPRHIKEAALAGTQDEADAKTRATVEGIIADVRARGDRAVRALSERFDNWSPASFRLSAGEIRELVAQVSPQTIDDIKFAQAQIRNFAEIQR